MKGWLIDPQNKPHLREFDYNGDWQSIAPALDCRVFDVVRLDDSQVMYVDDEGLYDPKGWILIKDAYQPFAGRGLFLGTDDEGGDADTTLTKDWFMNNVHISDGLFHFNLAGVLVGVKPLQEMYA